MLRTFFRTKLRNSTYYLAIFTVTFCGIIILSFISSIYTYKSYIDSNKQSIKQTTTLTENIITEVITEHSWQIRSIADKIMKVGSDLGKINQIITTYNKLDHKSNYDQFLNQKDLFWVDANDNIVIKNKVGILEYPKKISQSYEVFNSKKNPWKLIISKDLPSLKNDYILILTSFGVTDKNGKYLGSIVSSIDINLIQNLLVKKLNLQPNEEGLIVLNSYSNNVVFKSDPQSFSENESPFNDKIKIIDYQQQDRGFLKQEVSQKDISYNYYQKIEDYPFVIIHGYNKILQRSQIIRLLFKTVYPIIVIVGFLSLIAFILFYRRVVHPINRLSEIATEINHDTNHKLPKKINSPEIFTLAKALMKIKFQRAKLEKSNYELGKTKNQLEEAIEVIKKSDIAQIEIIKQIKKDISKNITQVFQVLNMLKHNVEGKMSPDTNLNLFLIRSLEQDIANITKFATDELNKEFIDIHNVINRAVLSQEKEIKIRNIKLDISYDKKLPKKIFVDQIRLIQILSSILHKTIGLLSEGNNLKILVKTAIRKKNKCLLIKIEDDGIGIGFKEYISDARNIGNKEESSINGIDISVETIEDLINLHQGEIVYDNKIQQGSTTTIILPCVKQIKRKPSKLPTKTADNIIYFPNRSK